MPTRKRPRDVNQLAAEIVREATSDKKPVPEDSAPAAPELNGKNPAAVELGRLGGLKGGPARAAKLSEKQRRESASKAARARWASRRT